MALVSGSGIRNDVNVKEEEERLSSLLSQINSDNKDFVSEMEELNKTKQAELDAQHKKAIQEARERYYKERFEYERNQRKIREAEERAAMDSEEAIKRRNPFYSIIKQYESEEEEKTNPFADTGLTILERIGDLVQFVTEKLYIKKRLWSIRLMRLLAKISKTEMPETPEDVMTEEELLNQRFEEKQRVKEEKQNKKQKERMEREIQKRKKETDKKVNEQKKRLDKKHQEEEIARQEEEARLAQEIKRMEEEAAKEAAEADATPAGSEAEAPATDKNEDTQTQKEAEEQKALEEEIARREKELKEMKEKLNAQSPEKEHEVTDEEYDAALDNKTRALKYHLQENHEIPSINTTEKAVNEIQKINDVLAIVMVSSDINNLCIFQDKEVFIDFVANVADYNVNYSYIYVVTQTASMYFGADNCFQELTNMFDEIRRIILEQYQVDTKLLLKIPGIKMFKNIYVD